MCWYTLPAGCGRAPGTGVSYARAVAVVRVRRVSGENVITLPPELEAQGFVPDAEVTIEPLEDGAGVALVLEASGEEPDRALLRRVVETDRPVHERLERYDRDHDA